MAEFTEDFMVEQPVIKWLKGLDYSYVHGSELNPENQERESYRQVILKKRFIEAIERINPGLTNALAEQAYKKVTELEHPDFIMKSKMFYEMLVNGVKITSREKGRDKTIIVKLIDFENVKENDFLVANQFTVECQYQKDEYRRPDLVVFVNGMPLAVFEFKSFNADETAKDAFYDHKAKMQDIPQLYVYAQVLVASDGLETKYGSVNSDWDRFFIWEGISGEDDLEVRELEGEPLDAEYRHKYYVLKETGKEITSLEVILRGLFNKEHFTEYLQDFILHEKSGGTYVKKIGMYHQFYTVREAVDRTKECVLKGKSPEERRIGVVWHTQGAGKSITMLFYARKTLKAKELENPLLLFITDRQYLDEQLSSVFSNILAVVKQAESINDLEETVKFAAGGIVFATIQKFGKKKSQEYPFLTDRKNIIIIADEAHRSQYRELAQNLRRAIPNASFMGFTATPIELQDRSTTLVFGDYISVYSMEKARRHKVVVPILYEARLSTEHLTNEFIDEEFEEISEYMDPETKVSLKKKFARLERIMLAEDRLEKIAKDIVEHFNKRVQELEGKAIIVTISRKVAVRLYEKIKKLQNAPPVEVVISGNKTKDPKSFWPHIRNKKQLEKLRDDFKDPETSPRMVIVVDMLLTGYDIPCLHTMYFDKPMKNHPLVQAIARVNRVFKDKPGGLIVDYIGIADDLRKSLAIYTPETIKNIFVDINEVLNQLKEKYDIISSLFYGINYKEWKRLPAEELSRLTMLAYDRTCKDEKTKKDFVRNFVALKKLYALASPHPEIYQIKDDIRFFEMIKKMIVKYSIAKVKDLTRDLEYEISHLISKSISAEEPVDVLTLMGKEKPDISIFDDRFLAEFRNMEYKNYAAELLAKIIKDQLVVKMRSNPFRYRSLYEMLKSIIDKYNVKVLDTVEVVEQLIKLAKDIKQSVEEGKKLNLSEEELAFYDLLSSKQKFFKNYEEVEKVAREIVKEMGYYVKVADWNRKEYLKAKIRTALKNVLIRTIDERVKYEEIEKLSKEIVSHAEVVYVTA
jgi:type I restriction enzyme R subunit